jgi:uncharacterized protein Yka (UPF0111/DUF47 family)
MAKKEVYDLQELYIKLVGLTDQLINAGNKLFEIKNEKKVAATGFKAGQAYSIIDKVSDELNDITDGIDRSLNH